MRTHLKDVVISDDHDRDSPGSSIFVVVLKTSLVDNFDLLFDQIIFSYYYRTIDGFNDGLWMNDCPEVRRNATSYHIGTFTSVIQTRPLLGTSYLDPI